MSDLIASVVSSFDAAAKACGNAQKLIRTAFDLARANDVTSATIDAYQKGFYLRGVMNACGVKEARALLVIVGSKDGGLRPFNRKELEKNDDTCRTEPEQTAFDNLKSAWHTGKVKSGMGAPVKPRAARTATTATKIEKTAVDRVADTVQVSSLDGLLIVAGELASEMRSIQSAGAKALKGDAGAILRKAFKDFADAVVAANKAKLAADMPLAA